MITGFICLIIGFGAGFIIAAKLAPGERRHERGGRP
jgi:hypothetical protein